MHIGGSTVIADEDLLLILPRETALASRDTRRALSGAIGGYIIQSTTAGTQRSYIICESQEKLSVYSSSVSSEWLSKRE